MGNPLDLAFSGSDSLQCIQGWLFLQVESVPLLPNTAMNGYVAVNMYVDDKGSIRNLPLNRRASEIAKCCGHPIEVLCA